MKQTLPDRVIYTLHIPQATSQDSGTYECSITSLYNREVRADTVAVTVFGELSPLRHFLDTFNEFLAGPKCYKKYSQH